MRFHGVFLVLVMLTLVFNTVSLGMVARLMDCSYEPYYREMTKACDKIYSYNSIRFWSTVFMPHDLIMFALVEGALIAILFSTKERQPAILCNIGFMSASLSAGMQVQGLVRHKNNSEDYSNFSEAYSAFCLLTFACMFLVEVQLMSGRAYGTTYEEAFRDAIIAAHHGQNAQRPQQQDVPDGEAASQGPGSESLARQRQPEAAGLNAADPPPYTP